MLLRIGSRLALAAMFSATPALAQAVLVVDKSNGPGTEYTSFRAAVGIAAPGDIVLFRTGAYENPISNKFTTTKPLTLIADEGHTVSINALDIKNLASDEYFLIHGLEQRGWELPNGLYENNQGPIWLENVRSVPRLAGRPDGGGLEIENCATVLLTDSSIAPPVFGFYGSSFLTTITCTGSWLGVHGTDVTGGSVGGYAIFGDDSTLEVIDSTIAGGDGLDGTSGDCFYGYCCEGEDGGHGIGAANGSTLTLLDATVTGGMRGDLSPPKPGASCTGGNTRVNGTPIILSGASTSSTLPVSSRRFDVSSPVRENANVTLTFEGLPGDRVWLLYALSPGTAREPRRAAGAVYLAPGHDVFEVGALDSYGQLSFSVTAPTLPAGVEGTVFFCQAVFYEAAAKRFVFGSARSLCVLSASI